MPGNLTSTDVEDSARTQDVLSISVGVASIVPGNLTSAKVEDSASTQDVLSVAADVEKFVPGNRSPTGIVENCRCRQDVPRSRR